MLLCYLVATASKAKDGRFGNEIPRRRSSIGVSNSVSGD